MPGEGRKGACLVRRRLIVLVIVGVVIGLVPIAAGAQTVEEKADALAAFEAAVDGLAGESLQEWIDGLAAFEEALETLEAVYGDELDYADVKLKADELQDAIDGEGLGHEAAIKAAGEALIGAANALAAEAAAAAEGGDGTEEPTGVATGGPVSEGPDAALLVVAALFALLAGGALVLRESYDRS
jgi:hypothetical protein